MSRINLNVKRKNTGFTIVDNEIVRNKDLKPTSRILLIFLLGCDQDKFTINTKSLASSIGVGVSAISSASKELQYYGYLTISRGGSGDVTWLVHEDPSQDQHAENQHNENQHVENQDVLRRNNTKEETIVKKESAYTLNKKRAEDLSVRGFNYIWEVWVACKNNLRVENKSNLESSFSFFKELFPLSYFKSHTDEEFTAEINLIAEYIKSIHVQDESGFCGAANLKTKNFFKNREWK